MTANLLRHLLGVLLIGAATGCIHRPLGPVGGDGLAAALAQPVEWETFDHALLAAALFSESNRARELHHLRRLRRYPRLERAADLQAVTSAMTGFPSHYNPIAGRANAFARVQAAGVGAQMVAENVAATPLRVPSEGRVSTAEGWPSQSYAELARVVVQQWLDSPPHRASLLSPVYTHLACGAALARGPMGNDLVFSVQVFIVPQSRRGS